MLCNELVIDTEAGQVRGIEERAGTLGDRYFSWKGIPYAEPPVGNLRFRDPVPHRAWSGIRDASEHGFNCATGGLVSDKMGNEDCLTLNVYTTSIVGKRPVMVWIHGGAFILGSGDDSQAPPAHFVSEDVLLVTINYRLGILGFLSTGDRHAPGNYAIKDMQLALRWVKNNILNFGGDPDNVTVFGQSAGGVAVHVLTLSPLSQGLFERAIVMSGTVLSSWAINYNPAQTAYDLADQLGISYLSNEDLVNRLREVPAETLFAVTPGLLDMEITRGVVSGFSYCPVIDAPDYEGPKVLPRDPRKMMEDGDFMDIPLIIGYTNEESLFMIREQILDSTVRNVVNFNRSLIVPTTLWNVNPNSPEGVSIANAFWDYYMDGQILTQDNRFEWSQYNSDVHFNWGADQCVRLHTQHKTSPLYYYVFSYDGSLNYLKRRLLLTSFPGAMHGDDLGYMFDLHIIPILPSNHANVVRRRYVRMWTNFAKTSNPTPDTDFLITSIWPRVTGNQEYMDIGDELVPGTNPFGDRMRLWNDLKARYVN